MGAQDTDVVIVGAGPAGIFCALALVERGFAGRIVMLDKGLAVEDLSLIHILSPNHLK